MDECQGTEARRSAEPSETRGAEVNGGGRVAGDQLPASEAAQEALRRGRGPSSGAWQCGPRVEPRQVAGSSQASAATGARELFGRAARALWADAGGRAFAAGPGSGNIGADPAAVDARRGTVDSPPQAQAPPLASSAQSPLRRADPARRFAPRLDRRTRPEGLSDELRR